MCVTNSFITINHLPTPPQKPTFITKRIHQYQTVQNYFLLLNIKFLMFDAWSYYEKISYNSIIVVRNIMQHSHTIVLLIALQLPQDLEHESCSYLCQPTQQLNRNNSRSKRERKKNINHTSTKHQDSWKSYTSAPSPKRAPSQNRVLALWNTAALLT